MAKSAGSVLGMAVLGAVVGGYVGVLMGILIPSGIFHDIFTKGFTIGVTDPPLKLDLLVVLFQFALAIRINLCSVLGILVALYYSR